MIAQKTTITSNTRYMAELVKMANGEWKVTLTYRWPKDEEIRSLVYQDRAIAEAVAQEWANTGKHPKEEGI